MKNINLKEIKLVNLTPHAIVIQNPDLNLDLVIEPSGTVARVKTIFENLENGIFLQSFGEVEGLPAPQQDTIFIVSAPVLGAIKRSDVFGPATFMAKRNEAGHIVSVPGLVQNL